MAHAEKHVGIKDNKYYNQILKTQWRINNGTDDDLTGGPVVNTEVIAFCRGPTKRKSDTGSVLPVSC